MIRPTAVVTAANSLGSPTPDYVIHFVQLAGAVLILWFALKALARRGSDRGLYRRLDPTVQSAKLWVASAPLTFTYVAIWTVTTVLQQGTPPTLNDLANRWQSTNIVGIATQPIRVLFSSAFIVADNGFGFLGYLVVFVLIVARLEHQLGAARTLLIAVAAHGLGSLLTASVEMWAIERNMAPEALKFTIDVGVSYVMVGSVGAYLWLVSRRWLPWLAIGVAIGVVVPMVVSSTIWDLGHFLATCLGAATGGIVSHYPRRTPLSWRDMRSRLNPRELPTFPNEPRPWPIRS